ncbi:hypothetical protein PFISCL1PPCAC_21919, partial [Pristionchus fissidentatus]
HYNNWTPRINETANFYLDNTHYPLHHELIFRVKDYIFARDDKLVGVGILQLASIVDQGNVFSTSVQLGPWLEFDEEGANLIKILSERVGDEDAQEFVKLKCQARYEKERLLED